MTASLPQPEGGGDAFVGPRRLGILATTLAPLVVALVLSTLVLVALGVDPLAYYAAVIERGLLSRGGLEASLTRMAPLLLIAASLIVAFRAGIWNLGGDGQFLLAAVAVAAAAPDLAPLMPAFAMLSASLVIGAAVGAAWSILPAILKAYQGVNEIVTTLMMTFLGASFANVLVKLAFRDPATTVPQTRTLPVDDRLPRLLGTTISSGLLIGLVTVLLVDATMRWTSFGLRLRLVGANTRAAIHAGLPLPRLVLTAFAISAALAGLAGAVEVLGVQGTVRADWNPAYGFLVVPLVFLARFDGVASILAVFLFSVLSIGGETAARRTGVPNYVTLVVLAILLVTLAVANRLEQRRRSRGTAK